LLIQSQLSYR